MPSPRTERLNFASSLDSASWIKSRLLPYERGEPPRFGHDVPSDYEKYIRIWYPPHGSINQRVLGSLEDRALGPLVSMLEAASNLESEECSFAFWEGWGHLDENLQRLTGLRGWSPSVEQAASFSLNEYRNYVLLTGPLSALLIDDTWKLKLSPQFWWPEGKAWFVASEVDFGFTLIGADGPLASAMLARDDLETDEIEWSDVIDDFGDGVS